MLSVFARRLSSQQPPPQFHHFLRRFFHNMIGAIDQGTTSTRVMIYDFDSETKQLQVKASHQLAHQNFFPQPGWVEHDPLEILNNSKICLQEAWNKYLQNAEKKDVKLKAIGITNQRETTVLWDSQTGKPLYNAIGNVLLLFV